MNYIVALIFLVLVSSCSSVPRLSDISCDTPKGVPQAKLLLFGEMHGSAEAPDFVGRIACSYALRNPTALGLEIPTSEQPAIDSYLASDGSASSQRELLSGAFWQSGKDGRASSAMATLLENVRKLKQKGLPLTVFTFDAPPAQSRDAALAQSIRDFHAKNPSLPIIALMGNIHASRTPIQLADQQIVTTGAFLQDLDPTSVLIAYRSGTIWACMPDCGVHQVSSKWGTNKGPGFVSESPMSGYSTTYVLPSITASLPAANVSR